MAEICCNHLSLYQLTVEHGTALSKSVKRGDIVRHGYCSQYACDKTLAMFVHYMNKIYIVNWGFVLVSFIANLLLLCLRQTTGCLLLQYLMHYS